MVQETVREVEMMYIQNTGGSNYTLETAGRRTQNVKLNFANVEGIEISAARPLEVKNSYIQMADGQPKMWNMRFAYPANFSIKYTGKIIIEVI
jgi:hypothetical protein